MPEADYEAFFESLDSEGQRVLNRRYTLYKAGELRPADADDLLAMYPALATDNFYILRDGINDFILEQISEIFVANGYTLEDKQAHESSAGMEVQEEEALNVTFSIYYTLDAGDLVVTVPMDEIIYDADYPLTQLRLLNYFGAGGLDDEGYIFVPDGSGALITFNNGKQHASQYLQTVYGDDPAVRKGLQVGRTEQIALPVFGVKKGEQAFLGIIEEGSALASIRADISGRVHSYNTVGPSFQILGQDEVDLQELAGNNVIMAYQQERYAGDLRVRYRFMEDEDASYSGMASAYRDYLLGTGDLRALDPATAYPLHLEVLGAIDKLQSYAGIPLQSIQALTTFEETAAIMDDLRVNGVATMNLRLTGWFNGGYRQALPNKIKVQRQLGSKQDLRALAEQAAETGVGFYPDASFTYVYRNTLFDGLIPTRDAARFLDREVVELTKYRPSSMQAAVSAQPYWLTAPRRVPSYVAGFLDDYSDLGPAGLTVRDVGHSLASDYSRRYEMDRESALDLWQEQLSTMEEQGFELLGEYGNAYILPYTQVLVDVPGKSSLYQITDRSVPFVQMVIHGSVDYSGTALNLSSDYRDAYLEILENGASPSFTVMQAKNEILKDSEYNHYYSVEYEAWRERILEVYVETAEVLGPLRTEHIVKHEELATGLKAVTYSNGTVIYINRSSETHEVEGQVLDAWDYLVR